jgi:hypothetical protein
MKNIYITPLDSATPLEELLRRSKTFFAAERVEVLNFFLEIAGNVEDLKAYLLTPLTSPLPLCHFTVPLKPRPVQQSI